MSLSYGANLDHGTKKVENEYIHKPDPTKELSNPYFTKKCVMTESGVKMFPHEMEIRDIYNNFNRLLVVCLKNEEVDIGSSLYENMVTCDFLKSISDDLIVIPGCIKMINNPAHRNNILIVSKNYLDWVNHDNVELDEYELVLPLMEISKNDAELYIGQYNGYTTLEDIFKLKVMNDYYCNKQLSGIVKNSIKNLITNCSEANYWLYNYNCQLNITAKFMDRGFNLSATQKLQNIKIKEVLEKLKTTEATENNYLSFLYRKAVYVDASSTIKKKGYRLYRVYEEDPDTPITKDSINSLVDSVKNRREFYDLINTLLRSKEYCHLVINNPYVLDKLADPNLFNSYPPDAPKKSFLSQYIPVYKYLFAYVWLILYIEESIKKTRIKQDDRFVFDINTAHKLPYFPYNNNDPHTCPYISLMVGSDVLDAPNNNLGIGSIGKYNGGGICNLETFKERFNIFTTGKAANDLFVGVDWNNIAVGGSVMTACIPKDHPLAKLKFVRTDGCNTEELMMKRYFDEYYSQSDIDIMCNLKDIYEFVDKVYSIYDRVSENLIQYNDDCEAENIKITPYKTGVIFINETCIRKYIVDVEGSEYEYEYVMLHLNDPEIKEILYPFYIKQKTKSNAKWIKTEQWTNIRYKELFDIVPIENVQIIFSRTKKDWEKYWDKLGQNDEDNIKKENHFNKIIKQSDDDDFIEINKKKEHDAKVGEDNYYHDYDEETNELLFFRENLKYKVESIYLPHNLEIFQIRYTEFFSSVGRFHLPCVRAYYNGDNVYMLPSAITAYMTNMNIDYKYFVGSKDPIEIVNKYRMRGFGTYLNDTEKIKLLEYSKAVDQWQNYYKINMRSTSSIKSVFGLLPLTHDLFKPRLINKEMYKDIVPVEENYSTSNVQYISRDDQMIEEYRRRYGYDQKMHPVDFLRFKCINRYGYINKLQPWILDAAYHYLH